MRNILIIVSLALGGTAAAAADCRAISDSAARLRCFDEEGVAQPYRGRIVFPDFAGRDRRYATYRTRIREAMREGPNFASHMTIVQIGCGTGCSTTYAADVRSGRVYDFPLGGEDQQGIVLRYSRSSNRITARWYDEKCHENVFAWTGTIFATESSKSLGDRETCFQRY